MNEQRKLDLSILYVKDEEVTREEAVLFLGRRVAKLATASNGRGAGAVPQRPA